MDDRTFTAFADQQRLVTTGPDLDAVVAAGEQAYRDGAQLVVVFDDLTGLHTELDPRGGNDAAATNLKLETPARSGPGRPKLGVVSREVSLLPRHWDWLNAQPGGASAAIRRLVEEASKQNRASDLARTSRDGLYRVMSTLGGDRPGFEEASRALYAERFEELESHLASWPDDIRTYVTRLARQAAAILTSS
jgi:hypothetical protein